jgi:hypothetical protein
MDFDLPHHVSHIVLKRSDALLPLFEAIINSIHSTRARGGGRITIEVQRSPQQSLTGKSLEPIDSFSVIDEGVGFTTENTASFKTYSSGLKASLGCKGVGRFIWLKAFDRVDVDSVYQETGEFYHRTFFFLLDPEGIHGERITAAAKEEHKTTVRLSGFKRTYRDSARHAPATLARKIINHCMLEFIRPDCPTIILLDGEAFDLNEIFAEEVASSSVRTAVTINSYQFDITNLRRYGEARNLAHYCAHSREVLSENLAQMIPELSDRLSDEDGRQYCIAAYVSGDYLDDSVNAERTDFSFDRPDSLLPDALTRQDLYQGVAEHVKDNYKDVLISSTQEKVAAVTEFIEREAPEFRIVKRHPEEIRKIPSGLGPERLRLELYKIKNRIAVEIKQEGAALLGDLGDDEEAYRKRLEKFLEDWNQLGMSELASYVVHRRFVLELLANSLKRTADGKYNREEVVHSLIFPLKTTSDEIDYEQQNLYLFTTEESFQ